MTPPDPQNDCVPLEEYFCPEIQVQKMSNREFSQMIKDPRVRFNSLLYKTCMSLRSERPLWLKVWHALGSPFAAKGREVLFVCPSSPEGTYMAPTTPSKETELHEPSPDTRTEVESVLELRGLEAWLKAAPLLDLSLLQVTEAEAANLHRAFFILWDCIRFAREGCADTLEEQIARQQGYAALSKALRRSRLKGVGGENHEDVRGTKNGA